VLSFFTCVQRNVNGRPAGLLSASFAKAYRRFVWPRVSSNTAACRRGCLESTDQIPAERGACRRC
jgi:hypothetical protein